jgi:hypothetical protein
MLLAYTYKTKENNHLHIMLNLCACVCFVYLRDQVDTDEMKDFFIRLLLLCRLAIGQPSFLLLFFFIHSFIHVFIHIFILFIHSSAWLAHEYMDVLLLCWFQKERTYEQKGRTGGEVKSILYTQQRRRHIKTTHVGQKKKEGERERERNKKK